MRVLTANLQTQGHWLRNPTIVALASYVKFYVSILDTVRLPPRVQKTSIKTMFPAEVQTAGLNPLLHETACEFKRTRGDPGQQCFPHVAIATAPPRSKHDVVAVIAPTEPVKVSIREDLSLSVYLAGETLVGRIFTFVKTERKQRGNPNTELIASLRLKDDIHNAPSGSYIRIPVQYVCAIDYF